MFTHLRCTTVNTPPPPNLAKLRFWFFGTQIQISESCEGFLNLIPEVTRFSKFCPKSLALKNKKHNPNSTTSHRFLIFWQTLEKKFARSWKKFIRKECMFEDVLGCYLMNFIKKRATVMSTFVLLNSSVMIHLFFFRRISSVPTNLWNSMLSNFNDTIFPLETNHMLFRLFCTKNSQSVSMDPLVSIFHP